MAPAVSHKAIELPTRPPNVTTLLARARWLKGNQREISSPLESLTNLLYLIQVSDSMEEIQRYAGIAQQELARLTEITARTLRSHRQPSKPTRTEIA